MPRANPIENISDEEFRATLGRFFARFGENWFARRGDHPVRTLWQKQDFLSSFELYSLAIHIDRCESINATWTRHQLKQIKSDDLKNIRGAAFELAVVSMFGLPPQQSIPAKNGAKALDLTIVTADPSRKLRTSVKNFGESTHHADFLREATRFREHVREINTEKGYGSCEISLHFMKYPGLEGWASVRSSLPDILAGPLGEWNHEEDPPWRLIRKGGDPEWDPTRYSDLIQAFAPYHPNESNNLWSKLEKAYFELSELSPEEGTLNVVVVHVPESASLVACEAWAESWMRERPDRPLSGVILLQTAVVRGAPGRTTLTVSLGVVVNPNHEQADWLESAGLHLDIPVGTEVRGGTRQIVVDEFGRQMDISECYVFQRGDFYVRATNTPTGQHGEMRSPARGVLQHAVMDPMNTGQLFVVKAKVLPDDERLLLL